MLYRRIKSFSTCLTFGVVLGAFVPMASFGADTKNIMADVVQKAWNGPSGQAISFEHSLKTGCVGNSLPNCEVWQDGWPAAIPDKVGVEGMVNRGTDSDEGATLVLVARQVNAHGANFCVTQIQAGNVDQSVACEWDWLFWRCWQRSGEGYAYTSYYEPTAGGTNNCFWLCQDGYFGDNCQSTDIPKTDDYSTDVIKAESFVDYKIATSGSNIENNLPMFFMNRNEDDEEYDTVLGVTRFLDSGNGAWVAPISVRANKYSYHDYSTSGVWGHRYASVPYLSAEKSRETLVCKNGYVHNPGHTDCIDANSPLAVQMREAAARAEAERNAQPCGLDWGGFNANQHEKVYEDVTNYNDAEGGPLCYTYTCKADNYVFKSTDDHSCVSCVGDMVAVSDDGKYCLSIKPCPGTIYTNYDSTKHAIRKTTVNGTKCYTYECKDAGYGFVSETDHTCTDCTGNSKRVHVGPNGVCIKCGSGSIYNANKPDDGYCPKSIPVSNTQLLYGLGGQRTNNISDQCWTYIEPDEYKTCVTQGLKAAQELARQRQNSK